MTAPTGERLLSDWFARLDAAALRLPPDRRSDLLEGIAEHVAAARAAGELHDERAVRTLLDRLGEPEEIVAAAGEDGPAAPWHRVVPSPPGTGLEVAAVLMLTVGSLLPVLGWLLGVALLWSSRRWRAGEKLLGTLVVPGGPGILLWLSGLTFGGESCTSAPVAVVPPTDEPEAVTRTVCESTGGLPVDLPEWAVAALLVFALVAPFVVAAVLLRRARARAATEPPVVRAVGTSPWTGLEVAAVLLLGIGSFVVPVVATLVGLVLVWTSPRWSPGEKAVASALVLLPVAALALLFAAAVVGLAGFALGLIGAFLLFAFGPVLAAGYLAVVLNRRPVG